MKKNQTGATGYGTYLFAKRSPKYDDTDPRYIPERGEKMKSQMKAQFFDTKDLIPIIGFVAKFNIVRERSNMNERAALWILPHYVKGTINNALSSCICADDRMSIFAASVRIEDTSSRKKLRSYQVEVNHMLKKYPSNQEIAKNGTAVLLYAEPSSMTPQQYVDVLIAGLCKIATV